MHRYAAGFAAGAVFLALTETAVFMRAIHRALTDDDVVADEYTITARSAGPGRVRVIAVP